MGAYSFRVIIVGGSITGMTLAHCLDRAGIDYVILEKHKDIFAEPGISIGLMPNGSRILEQLGIYSDVHALFEGIKKIYQYMPDGYCIETDSPVNIVDRFGLPFCVIDRYQFLKVLYSKFEDKSRFHMNKKVTSICHGKSDVSVTTADGETYHGDLVVGADGVHSVVRSEMWRIGNLARPGFVTEREKSELAAEFACVFGVAKAVPGQGRWEHILRYNEDFCFMFFPASGTDVFFNVIYKLNQKYVYPDIPRFTKEEGIEVCESVGDFPVWEDVKFRDIWAQRIAFTCVPLEEHMFKNWHHRRIICVGDSVSKMSPNMGQGGNTAIESAAALTNGLRKLVTSNYPDKPSERQLSNTLETFNRNQFKRLNTVHGDARYVTRLEALDGTLKRVFARYVMGHCGDLLVGNLARIVAGGGVLDFIPLTARSGKDWPPCPWQHSWGISESIDFCKKFAVASLIVLIVVLARALDSPAGLSSGIRSSSWSF
uniref:FAD-dependent monooxygenase aurC n=1 Tax=Calcarisporium arbuscula TaxID=240499 RepID=AURC_CALAK|nr:RecName: Full=FAD-dependent monooxygenase aurC; AltName: Full=Aurovertin biosynthesis cluster protein C; Flags: Precursor [Calcarisporium arbuscula]ALD83629.1 FAD-dependent monooxygenase [Calcarisporium arbuscula]